MQFFSPSKAKTGYG